MLLGVCKGVSLLCCEVTCQAQRLGIQAFSLAVAFCSKASFVGILPVNCHVVEFSSMNGYLSPFGRS